MGRRPDGYHELDTLVVFADVGDRLAMLPGSAPGIELIVSGEFARDLPHSGADNLVAKAVKAFFAAADEPVPPLRFDLSKRLPVAAGIGGGSADAAACLRILHRAFPGRLDRAALMACAGSLGADVPMCFESTTLRAQGRGERFELISGVPPISLVLAKPRAKLETRTVFEGLRLPQKMPLPPLANVKTAADLVPWLSATRNDLEPRARELAPEIALVLEALSDHPGFLFARMSGSGPTCFALYRDAARSQEAASALQDRFPDWWVVATTAETRSQDLSREPSRATP